MTAVKGQTTLTGSFSTGRYDRELWEGVTWLSFQEKLGSLLTSRSNLGIRCGGAKTSLISAAISAISCAIRIRRSILNDTGALTSIMKQSLTAAGRSRRLIGFGTIATASSSTRAGFPT